MALHDNVKLSFTPYTTLNALCNTVLLSITW